MSRDDTIGVFSFKYKGKCVYTVIHAQGIEDVEEDWEYFKFLCDKFTYNKRKAFWIAKETFKHQPYCEYGICFFECHKDKDFA